MNQTLVTLTGWIGGEVNLRMAGDAEVASFRLALTPRRHNRRTDEWYDGPTQWWTVNAWRTLGRHCAESLHSGDAVVVHGRADSRSWTNADGVEITSMEIDAAFVGHDLNRGTSAFTRTAPRPARPESVAPVERENDEVTATGVDFAA